MKTLLILCVLMGMALAQGMTYKLKVSEWSCQMVRGELVAQGSVLNQSGGMLRAVRVKPSTLRQVTCQIWFRSPDSVQIPTRVPSFR
ncbi:MAG: hypothetical protein IVW51_11780 [Thermaceae bacterium]|nr:hypothetical protein [Thermaceae bacterium]